MIQTNEPQLNLGDLKVNQDTFFEVKLLNTYGDPKILTVQFSCGACTSLVSAPDVIPPGREGIFKFRFHPTATGVQAKSIFFDIAGQRETSFLFAANVTQ